MFTRALNVFKPSAATPPPDLENPLLPATNAAARFPNRRCDWLVPLLIFLVILVTAFYCFAKDVNEAYNNAYNNPEFRLDPVVVSSFNVAKAFHKATAWEATLSLEGNFKKLDLRYEVPRLWIYSGDEGSVSMTSPSLKYSRDGKKLILRGVFGMEEDVENRVVNLDMVMESNTLRIVKMHSSKVEIKSFLMIICEDLKIEFDPLTKRYGTLTESGKSCRVQVCPIEPHPLYDGVDKCNSS
ncbi:hypothetical protein SASPL_122094 [Salvia splendens]|uniref:Uncharacterized protein n=1 Tax=Salvia splendens TaxID=180675 RepID=A0A8X8XNN4_SALSN|nr:uncharacterized protein LOC121744235 [Salvia splendens]KAG6414721.1 hypothetical protein SASPL_122094 [Salvia splendens]